jgi:hypothetical protein
LYCAFGSLAETVMLKIALQMSSIVSSEVDDEADSPAGAADDGPE